MINVLIKKGWYCKINTSFRPWNEKSEWWKSTRRDRLSR